jgi:hypothetical protein
LLKIIKNIEDTSLSELTLKSKNSRLKIYLRKRTAYRGIVCINSARLLIRFEGWFTHGCLGFHMVYTWILSTYAKIKAFIPPKLNT